MKSQIQSKKNGGIAKLLIPILNNIIRNQGTYFVVIMGNHLKIISAHGASLLKYGKIFSKKKLFMRGLKHFWGKKLWEIILNSRTNDQIMPRFGRSFITDTFIFPKA